MLSPVILSGFVRIVTNPRIFDPETPMATALEFCERLVRWPRSVLVFSSQRHWEIFVNLCRRARIQGPLVTDVYIAAMAIDVRGVKEKAGVFGHKGFSNMRSRIWT